MKKIYAILFLLVAISTAKLNAQWAVVGAPDFSGAYAGSVSLAVDNTTGTAYVAYADGFSNKLTVKKFSGAAWVTVGSAQFSAGGASNINIITVASNPVVAYCDASLSGAAVVMKYSSNTWSAVGGAQVSSGAAYTLSLAADSAHYLYVAYSDAANGSGATVMKYSGSWAAVGGANFTGNQVNYVSLAEEGGVLYCASGTQNAFLQVWSYSGSWTNLTSGIPSGTITGTSIAVDKVGTPYVAYTATGGSSSVYKYSGGSWSQVSGAAVSANAQYLRMAVDGNNVPYLAYDDITGGNKLTVVSYNGSWAPVGSADFTNSIGGVAFAIYTTGIDNVPVVAYIDQVPADSNKVTVMSYGTLPTDTSTAISNVAGQVALKLYPNPAGSMLNINSELPVTEISIFNLEGQLLINEKSDAFTHLNIGGLTTGLYLAQIRTANGVVTQKLVKE